MKTEHLNTFYNCLNIKAKLFVVIKSDNSFAFLLFLFEYIHLVLVVGSTQLHLLKWMYLSKYFGYFTQLCVALHKLFSQQEPCWSRGERNSFLCLFKDYVVLVLKDTYD